MGYYFSGLSGLGYAGTGKTIGPSISRTVQPTVTPAVIIPRTVTIAPTIKGVSGKITAPSLTIPGFPTQVKSTVSAAIPSVTIETPADQEQESVLTPSPSPSYSQVVGPPAPKTGLPIWAIILGIAAVGGTAYYVWRKRKRG